MLQAHVTTSLLQKSILSQLYTKRGQNFQGTSWYSSFAVLRWKRLQRARYPAKTQERAITSLVLSTENCCRCYTRQCCCSCLPHGRSDSFSRRPPSQLTG